MSGAGEMEGGLILFDSKCLKGCSFCVLFHSGWFIFTVLSLPHHEACIYFFLVALFTDNLRFLAWVS